VLLDNSPIQLCLGGGNKIVRILVAKLRPFFSAHLRSEGTDENVSIRFCRSSKVPAPSIDDRKANKREVCRVAKTMTAHLQFPHARAYVAFGKRSEAVKLLNDLKKRSSPVSSHASEIAVIYGSLGDTNQAMN
jgi:hypothetical protein